MTSDTEFFDINEGAGPQSAQWPVLDRVFSAEQYANEFSAKLGAATAGSPDLLKAFLENTAAAALLKANPPPEMVNFSRFTVMPDPNGKSIIPWPGIPPMMLMKVMEDQLLPKLIVNQRVLDVMRYADYSTHLWKPGWCIDMREGFDYPTEKIDEAKKAARNFLLNCNIDTTDARKRDSMGLTNFHTFLAQLIRDSLVYDGMAVWTDLDTENRIRAFKCLSAYNIRLCDPTTGYEGNPDIYAVGVDDGANVIQQFGREDLIWRVRNPRADSRAAGYGWPEIDQALRIVQAFSNMFDMNADAFNKNGIPNGILKVTGSWTQRQLDVLSRIWMNIKKGVTKQFAIPVIPVPANGDIEMLELMAAKGEDARYQDFSNMLAGAYCLITGFPVDRLGYHTSGGRSDSKPDEVKGGPARIDQMDPGLGPLLTSVEVLVNEYLLWTRWPFLKFGFQAKSPVEDARAYEIRTLAMTIDERRALVDLPKLVTVMDGGEDTKEIAKLAGAGPVDPAAQGTYQALASSYFQSKYGAQKSESSVGAPFTSKKDPAESMRHGAEAGVRRDSAKEGK